MGVPIGDLVPRKEIDLENLYGKKIAIDALNAIYQFLSTIRQRDGTPLMDSKGRITSHLSGLFYRTINLMEAGIKPPTSLMESLRNSKGRSSKKEGS